MKLELPLAVLLIAGGCWLAATNYLEPASEVENSAASAELAPIEGSSSEDSSREEAQIDETFHNSQRAGNGPWIAPRSAGQGTIASLPLAAITPQAGSTQAIQPPAAQPEMLRLEINPDPEATRLVARATEELNGAPAIKCSVRLSMNMFDAILTANGSYLQEGLGTRRAKLEIEAGDLETGIHLNQVCDGRFYYRKITSAESSTLEFVDLDRVYPSFVGSESLASFNGSNSIAATWMMTGNLACLIGNLSRSFVFGPAHEAQLGEIPALSVRGLWNEDALRQSLAGQIEPELIASEIDWARLPDQVPHAVEITFGNDEYLPLFPYRISFLRFSSDEQRIDDVIEICRIELYDVSKSVMIEEDEFKVSTDDVLITDRTDDYIYQIERRREAIRAMYDQLAQGQSDDTGSLAPATWGDDSPPLRSADLAAPGNPPRIGN